MSNEGQLLVISAPSGAGKTTLVHKLLAVDPRLRFSVSYTTRARRSSEVSGRDYFFVDAHEFQRMIRDNEFLEHAQVFDNYYGTGKAHVRALIEDGFTVLLEIDWQGARQVRASQPDAVSVFILPPSRSVLEQRLRFRKTDSEAVIRRRLADAMADMSHWREFDYVVINDDLAEAVAALRAIVAGEGDDFRTDNAELATRARLISGSPSPIGE